MRIRLASSGEAQEILEHLGDWGSLEEKGQVTTFPVPEGADEAWWKAFFVNSLHGTCRAHSFRQAHDTLAMGAGPTIGQGAELSEQE